jgi:long-chain fatty acid transport protein
MLRSRDVTTASLFLMLTLAPLVARAGVTEMGAVGVQAVGRAGAFVARASDPTALGHNVAGIVGLEGVQWTASMNVGFWRHCFTREGRYDGVESGVETRTTVFADSRYATERPFYPEVCNDGAPSVVPQLLVTWRPRRWIAVGGGLLTPAGIGTQNFPDRVQTSAGLAPSPARYMVLATNVALIHPTIGVAFAPTDWLRVGAALQPSFGRFAGETMANAIGSQSPATDIRTAANAWGFFWAANLGVMVQPAPWITLGAHAHLNQSPVVFSGTTTATVRPYASDPDRRHQSQFSSEVTLPLPNLFRVGARFASLRAGAPAQWADRDPMRDETFDLEIDFHYETSSALQQVVTRSSGIVEVEPGMGAPATPEVVLRRSWRDTMGVRIAAERTFIPNEFAVRAGISWDLGAQTGARTYNGAVVGWNPDAGIDTAGYDTFGLALGASYRWRFLTIDVAYQHIFTTGQAVVEGRAPVVSGTVPITPADCARGAGYPGPGACSNNQGTFSAGYDILSIGITGRH